MLKNEKKDDIAKNNSAFKCVIGLLTLLSVCSLALVVLFLFSLQKDGNYRNDEIRYLFLVPVENESELSDSSTFDASIIDGGVVKVFINSPYFAEELGVLYSVNSESTSEDILYSYFDYLGAFGWEFKCINNGTFIFCRNT